MACGEFVTKLVPESLPCVIAWMAANTSQNPQYNGSAHRLAHHLGRVHHARHGPQAVIRYSQCGVVDVSSNRESR